MQFQPVHKAGDSIELLNSKTHSHIFLSSDRHKSSKVANSYFISVEITLYWHLRRHLSNWLSEHPLQASFGDPKWTNSYLKIRKRKYREGALTPDNPWFSFFLSLAVTHHCSKHGWNPSGKLRHLTVTPTASSLPRLRRGDWGVVQERRGEGGGDGGCSRTSVHAVRLSLPSIGGKGGGNNRLTTEQNGGMREELQSGNNGRKTRCRREKRQHRNTPRRAGGRDGT